MSAHQDDGRGQRALSLALGVPALLVMLLALGVEVWRVVAPAQAEAGHRVYGSLGEAIVMNDVAGAYGFIRGGQDPNALITVHDAALTGGQPVHVAPILWATAAGRDRIVNMLLGAGVTFERNEDRRAPCLADRLGFPGIAAALRAAVPDLPAAASCPAAPAGPPLLNLGE